MSERGIVLADKRPVARFRVRTGQIPRSMERCRVSGRPNCPGGTPRGRRGPPMASVSSPRLGNFLPVGCFSFPQTPGNKPIPDRVPEAGPRFPDCPRAGVRGRKNSLRPVGEIPTRPRGSGGAWPPPRGLYPIFVRPRQANIGPQRASFFPGSAPFGPGASKLPESWRSSARP